MKVLFCIATLVSFSLGDDAIPQVETNPANVVIRTIAAGGGNKYAAAPSYSAPSYVAPSYSYAAPPQPAQTYYKAPSYAAPAQNIQFVQAKTAAPSVVAPAYKYPTSYVAPAAASSKDDEDESATESGPVNYAFEYKVDDPSVYKVQSQQESADNGIVKGSYTVLLPDGFLQIVRYTADKDNGFQAEIERQSGAGPVYVPPPPKPESKSAGPSYGSGSSKSSSTDSVVQYVAPKQAAGGAYSVSY